MAKAQLYMLRLGYQEIGVGTINQVQAAQKALEALQLVDRQLFDDSEGNRQRVVSTGCGFRIDLSESIHGRS